MSAATIAFPANFPVEWLDKTPSEIPAKERERFGLHYTPWKFKDWIGSLATLSDGAVRFLLVLHGHTHDGLTKKWISVPDLAIETNCCPRTIQNRIAEAKSALPGFEVKRKGGRENIYRLTLRVLFAAGAISFRKPKPEVQAATDAAPSLKPTKRPDTYSLFIPDWLQKRMALRAEAMVGSGPEGHWSAETAERVRANEEARRAARAESARKEAEAEALASAEAQRRNHPATDEEKRTFLDDLRARLTDAGVLLPPRAG